MSTINAVMHLTSLSVGEFLSAEKIENKSFSILGEQEEKPASFFDLNKKQLAIFHAAFANTFKATSASNDQAVLDASKLIRLHHTLF